MNGIMDKLIPKYNLLFVRHGSTALNEDGDKIRGWRDVPLSLKGRDEAKDTANSLKDKPFDVIIASDLKRTRQTAEIISKETGKPIMGFFKELRPWDAGIYTGVESAKAMEHFNRHMEHPDEKIPEGESFNHFKDRFLGFVLNMRKYLKRGRMLMVAHHRNNVLLDAWVSRGKRVDKAVDISKMKEKGISPGQIKEYNV